MLNRGALILVLLAFCAESSTDPGYGQGDALSVGDSHVVGDNHHAGDNYGGGDSQLPDPAVILELRAGTRTAYQTMEYVAGLDGWPRPVAGGYLFAHVDDGQGPYLLAGDHVGWTGVTMALEHGLYWLVVAVSQPDNVMYKFVDGVGTFTADPWSRRYGYDSYGQFSLVEMSAAHLERFFALTDGNVSARNIRVLVPGQTPTHHLYVHDGQNLFDPDAIWGGWRLQDSLGASTLAIGIDNTVDRMEDYTHVPDYIGDTWYGGGGDQYASFVANVVRPLVESEYGTPPRVGVMGSSLGGLIAFHQVLLDPTAFDFAASLSGTFGWGSIGTNNETLIERFATAGHLPTALFLDSGGGPGAGCVDSDSDGIEDDSADAADNYCENRQLADLLATLGYTWDVDLWHWWEQDAPHNERAWGDRVWRPIGIFEAM
ncbi:alpha/beta hydrolase [Myxococcota bacterium]